MLILVTRGILFYNVSICILLLIFFFFYDIEIYQWWILKKYRFKVEIEVYRLQSINVYHGKLSNFLTYFCNSFLLSWIRFYCDGLLGNDWEINFCDFQFLFLVFFFRLHKNLRLSHMYNVCDGNLKWIKLILDT